MHSRLKIIPILQTISAVISLLLVCLATFLSFVDGVALMFSYISLPFALLAYSRANIKLIKLFGVLFIISHIPFAIMAYNSSNTEQITTSEMPNFKLFEKCSNEMFRNKDNLEQPLTQLDHKRMAECMKQGEQAKELLDAQSHHLR